MGIFDNPFYREQMFALGLQPETAYGCAFDFLLYPQPKVQNQLLRFNSGLAQSRNQSCLRPQKWLRPETAYGCAVSCCAHSPGKALQ